METKVLQRYPIGRKEFSIIRNEGFLYVDKTDLVYRLTHMDSSYIFLSRPRRFGKSLLVSTLKAYFEGKKDLFKGLAIEKLEKEWIEYPVLHLDFCNLNDIVNREDLIKELNERLQSYEDIYGHIEGDIKPGTRLKKLISQAYKQTGKEVVVLIDEYDAPILDALNKDILEAVRGVMKNFYSALKEKELYLKFVFLTGITKFSQLSIFSELNNIKNISMDKEYASLCGITHDEMLCSLRPGIENLAKENALTYEEAVDKLKFQYDGYHFCWPSPDIYNPYSLLNALDDKVIKNFWFTTGTPIFLIETLRRFNTNLIKICKNFISKNIFDAPVETMKRATPLLYQAGYLTIKDYDSESGKYLLDFPNEEVHKGLTICLLDEYLVVEDGEDNDSRAKEVASLIKEGKIKEALEKLQKYFKTIGFAKQKQNESHYQQLLYMFLDLGGIEVKPEERISDGQIDLVIYLESVIYVIELKLDKTIEEAIKQIDEKEYAHIVAFKYPKHKVYKVGINFSEATRTISDFIIKLL